MDTNMQHHTTNALVQILIQEGLKKKMLSISDSEEQSILYSYEHIKKSENFINKLKQYIISHLIEGSFFTKEELEKL